MTASVNAQAWTPRQDELLRKNPDIPDSLLAERVSAAGPSRNARNVGERRLALGLRRNGSYGWTDERTAEMLRRDKAGESAAQIAHALGGVSRNAVIGKLHRMGLTSPERAKVRMEQSGINRAARRPKPAKAAKPLRAVQPSDGPPTAPMPKPAAEIKTAGPTLASLNLRITDPGFGGCRWPTMHDGDQYRFCCVPSGGEAYCPAHARRAFSAIPIRGPKSAAELIRSVRRIA